MALLKRYIWDRTFLRDTLTGESIGRIWWPERRLPKQTWEAEFRGKTIGDHYSLHEQAKAAVEAELIKELSAGGENAVVPAQ